MEENNIKLGDISIDKNGIKQIVTKIIVKNNNKKIFHQNYLEHILMHTMLKNELSSAYIVLKMICDKVKIDFDNLIKKNKIKWKETKS